MLAYVSDAVFAQIWIGAEDKLPRKFARCTATIRRGCIRHGALQLAARRRRPRGRFQGFTGDAKPIEFAGPTRRSRPG